MDLQRAKIFETTAFEVTEYQKLHSYTAYSDKLPLDQLKEAVIKLPEVVLYDSSSALLKVITDRPFDKKQISCTINDQTYLIIFEEYAMSSKAKLELLFNHAIEFSEGIIRVSEKLYFIPSETFVASLRKNEKSKIYPFFCFEILELESKALIKIEIKLYSQNYPNLMKALEEDYLQKSSSLNQLIVPLFKYKVNFLLFDSENEKGPTQDLRSLEFYESKENEDRLVRLKHLDTEEYIVMSATNFNVLNRLDETTLIHERLYLLYKLKIIIVGLDLIRRCGIEISSKTHKPDLIPANAELVDKMDLQSSEDENKLANWMFICNKEDVNIGSRLAKDLLNTIRHVFRLDNFKPPVGYTVEAKEDQIIEESILEGLMTYLTDSIALVVILINKDKPFTVDLEHFLLSKNKKFLIFEGPELASQRNYTQTKIDELYMDFRSEFKGVVLGYRSPIIATFVKLKHTAKGAYMYSSSVYITENEVTVKKTISRPSDFVSLDFFVKSLANPAMNQIFFIVNYPEKLLAEKLTAKNVVFVSNSSLSLFPNFVVSDYYSNTNFDLQSLKSLITNNKTGGDSELVASYNRSFVYGKVDRSHMIILNQSRSYCLKFVESLSELDLPLVENIFMVVRCLKNDFAFYLLN